MADEKKQDSRMDGGNNDSDDDNDDETRQVVNAMRTVGVSDGEQQQQEASDDDEVDDEEEVEIPSYMVGRVEKLKELNKSRNEIVDDYRRERAALEAKYEALYKPLYDQRAAVIAGDHDDEGQAAIGADNQDENGGNGETVPRGIPHFWCSAMGNHEDLAELVEEDDVDCLEHLKDIQCKEELDSFTLELHFGPNPYFTNTVLTKTYIVPNLQSIPDEDPLIRDIQGCEINWIDERHTLTYRETTKRQRGKGKNAGRIRTLKKKERKESFFHFFCSPPKLPEGPHVVMTEEEAEKLEETVDSDFEVAMAIRKDLIPKAIWWFLNEEEETEEEREMREAMMEQEAKEAAE